MQRVRPGSLLSFAAFSFAGFLSAAIALSCGGQAYSEGDMGGAGATDEPAVEPDPGPSTGANGNMGRGGRGSGSTSTLQPCQPGPRVGEPSAAACNWTVEGRCYAERDAACACACPRDRPSRCISGLEGNQVPVLCI